MDFKQLATELVVLLSPFFPFLIVGAEEFAKKAGEKFGEASWEKAKSIWIKIQSFAKDDTKAKSSINGLIETPEDNDYQLILAKTLAKHLENSPSLAMDLLNIIKNDEAIQKVLIDKKGTVKDIRQRLSSKGGTQEVTVRGKARDITQEQ